MSTYGSGKFDTSTLDTTTYQSLVFFGNERIATGVTTNVAVLRALLEAGYVIKAIVTNHDMGQSRNARQLEIAQIASEHAIPLLLPNKLSDITTELESYHATAGVLVAYGKLIPQSIIDLFPKGIINIHPSLLPLHRGPTPLESVILDGSKRTGVSIMALAKAMDAGPIYGQAEYELTGTETKQILSEDLLELGAGMLIEILPDILRGSVTAMPQDATAAIYDGLISKDAGILDWSKPALQLTREVRAYATWPKSRTTIAGKEVVITRAHNLTVNENNFEIGKVLVYEKQLCVATSDGLLVIDSIKPAGKAEMSAQAFLAGYGQAL